MTTLAIKHSKVSLLLDVPDSDLVRPSDWNEAHKITMSPGVIGRPFGSGDGVAEVLPFYTDSQNNFVLDTTASMRLPSGSSGQRPTTPVNGQVRFNTTTKRAEMWVDDAWYTMSLSKDRGAPTGSYMYTFAGAASYDGWIRCIGWIAKHGATGAPATPAGSYAEDDAKDLYILLWDLNFTVNGGRGLSGLADWDAGKWLALPDLRERVLATAGNLGGNTVPNVLSAGMPGGFTGAANFMTFSGDKQHSQTVAEMAVHKHGIDVPALALTGSVTHNVAGNSGNLSDQAETQLAGGDGVSVVTPMNIVQPTFMMNALIKL